MLNTLKKHPRHITLKNGTQILIREAQETDFEGLKQCIKTYLSDSEYLPKLPEEMTMDSNPDWIKSYINSNNSLLLVAEYENQIIGNIDATGSKRKAMEHTAVIGMGMRKEWRNQGLGKVLLSSIIEWAQENPLLETLWLQVYADNLAAKSLYQKLGFIETGTIQNYFKHQDRYHDNITMVLALT